MLSENSHLERFVAAQAPVYARVVAELAAGRKQSHWMWFVFPQMRGLGHSRMAEFYGIASLEEARAYLAHPVLGRRLVECAELVLTARDRSLHDIFGSPDDVKFCSSMSLFTLASGDRDAVFQRALDRFCNGVLDPKTVALATGQPSSSG